MNVKISLPHVLLLQDYVFSNLHSNRERNEHLLKKKIQARSCIHFIHDIFWLLKNEKITRNMIISLKTQIEIIFKQQAPVGQVFCSLPVTKHLQGCFHRATDPLTLAQLICMEYPYSYALGRLLNLRNKTKWYSTIETL